MMEKKPTHKHQIVTTTTAASEVYDVGSAAHYQEPTISFNASALVGVIETVVQRLIPNNKSPLAYLRDIEEAYQNGWQLSTSELANLLKLSPKTITNYGQEFSDAGFIFARAGTRKGGEIAWSIEKDDSLTDNLPSSTKGIKAAFSEAFDP
ncbi:MAG: hypothetical protein AAGE84_20145 [Cyanobacteria bacterium P01_G01_bin.39]